MAADHSAPRLPQGMYCEEAATELIIALGAWLRRDDLTWPFVHTQAGLADRITAVIDCDPAIAALRAGNCTAQEARPRSATWPPASPPPHP